MRVLLAGLGTREELLAAVTAAREDAEELVVVGERIGQEYATGTAPFQHDVHLRAFVFDFLNAFARTLEEWASRTHERVEHWQDLSPAGKQEEALAIIRQAMASPPAALVRTNPGDHR